MTTSDRSLEQILELTDPEEIAREYLAKYRQAGSLAYRSPMLESQVEQIGRHFRATTEAAGMDRKQIEELTGKILAEMDRDSGQGIA